MNLAILADSWTHAWVDLESQALFSATGWHAFPVLASIFSSLGYKLSLYTKPGASNHMVISNVHNRRLNYNTTHLQHIDYVIFIQTDPFRDIISNKYLCNNNSNSLTVPERFEHLGQLTPADFLEYRRTLCKLTYKSLNRLSVSHFNGAPILCLGGAGRLESDLICDYANLHCVTDSIFDALQYRCKADNILQQPKIFLPVWKQYITERWNPELIQYIFDQIVPFEDKLEAGTTLASNFFKYDIGHPNGSAYVIIADIILKYIEDNFSLPDPGRISY